MIVANIAGTVLRLSSPILSDRMKRVIFVGSFSAEVRQKDLLDDATLNSINQLLAVSERDQALLLPGYLHKVIWNGKNIPDIANRLQQETLDEPSKLEQLIAFIRGVTPAWLVYENVENDIRTMLTHKTVVLGK